MLLFIGNCIAFIASLTMICSGIIKDKKKILYTQSIYMGLFVVSNIVLGGITGAIINLLGVIRNILCYYDKLDIKTKIIITLLSAILTVMFNNLGLIGYLPLIAVIFYNIFMTAKNIIIFKILIILTTVLWAIYDFNISSYTSCFFDAFTVLSNLISIWLIKKNNQISRNNNK